jgi:hypothetical protein
MLALHSGTTHKVKEFFKLGARYPLGNGEKIQFWKDWWIGEGTLAHRFPSLSLIASDPDSLVSHLYRNETWSVHFHRSFGQEDRDGWIALQQELSAAHPLEAQDSVSRALKPSGKFSARLLYLRLVQGATVAHAKDIWKIACPLKVRIFIWQLARGRLPANDQIRKLHAPSDELCRLCN